MQELLQRLILPPYRIQLKIYLIMISVQIIDNTNQIKTAISNADCEVSSHDDEVQALIAIEKKTSSVILLNYSLRKEQTADYLKLILEIRTDSKIVVMGDELNEKEIVNCLSAGAKGYQEIKQLDMYANKLISVINAGEAWISRRMVAILLESLMQNRARQYS